MAEIWQLLKMTWPVIAGVALLVFALLSRKVLDRTITFQPTIAGVVLISKQLTVVLARIVLIMAAVGLIFLPTFMDYSAFFPQRVKIDVYFDDDGISAKLAGLAPETLESLNMSTDWRVEKQTYFSGLNDDLKAERIPFQFPADMSAVHGIGRGVIRFRKIGWGIQEYKVEKADGNITLMILLPGTNTFSQLETTYSLLDTTSNFVTVAPRQMYWDREIIVRPTFQQIITLSQGNKRFHHTLMGLTRISILPPKYQPTVYFSKSHSGKTFPIGYAVYEPDSD